jgi:hypothetical protein
MAERREQEEQRRKEEEELVSLDQIAGYNCSFLAQKSNGRRSSQGKNLKALNS